MHNVGGLGTLPTTASKVPVVRAARNTLVRSAAFALLLGAMTVLWPAPAQALIPGLTIDDYSGDTPPGTRTGTGAGGGSVTFTSGVARVSVPGANGVSPRSATPSRTTRT